MIDEPKIDIAGHVFAWIADATGVDVPTYRRKDVLRAAQGNAAKLLVAPVSSSEPVPAPLVEALRVGETYFFRHARQLEFLTEVALPELRRKRAMNHVFQLWSAGCATGEEPYTLSILLQQAGLGEHGRVLGTDLSEKAIEHAREATYGSWSVEREERRDVDTYFKRVGARFRLLPIYQRAVLFARHNLARDAFPPPEMRGTRPDVIFCRNVLMYFKPDVIAAVARRFYECLADDGWLVAGPSDPSLFEHAPFDAVTTPYGVFYRKTTDATRSVRPLWTPLAPAAKPSVTEPPSASFYVPARALSPRPLPPLSEPPRAASLRALPPEPARSEPIVPPAPAPVSLVARAAKLLEQRDYGAVVTLGDTLIADAHGARLYVRASASSSPPGEARDAADRAIGLHPLDVGLHYLRALICIDAGDSAAALAALRSALYLDPNLPEPHFMLGLVLEASGDRRAAARGYHQACLLCEALPAEQVLSLADGERAADLAAAAAGRLAQLRPELEP